jgi:deoxyribonuclease-4
MIIGSHVSLGGTRQFLGSVEETIQHGANALMVYTGAPQNTLRTDLKKMRIDEAKELMINHGIRFEHIIVHAPYIVNLANPDMEKQAFAVSFLTEEVKRTEALGSTILVLHPGAHMGDGAALGIERIAQGINKIIENTPHSHVVIALETMAGKGTEVGCTFEEIRQIIDRIEQTDRIGVCYDTCHTHDAGYDLIHHFDDVLNEFDRIIGLSYLKVVHINDSKNDLGAHKDRHANIGFGYLGFETINYVVHHPRLETIPKILETPYVDDLDDSKKSYPPYKYEIEMLKNKTFVPDLLNLIRESEKNQ